MYETVIFEGKEIQEGGGRLMISKGRRVVRKVMDACCKCVT